MRRYGSIEEYRASDDGRAALPCAVSLGKFDGIHIGHARLIRLICEKASAGNILSMVFAIVMKDDSILSREERAYSLEALGVDVLVECPFSPDFMSMSPSSFVRNVLMDVLHARFVCVGSDFAFGYNREGNARILKDLCGQYGCETEIVQKEQLHGEDVSSTRVRLALAQGDMKLVEALMGRPYPIRGEVVHGRHLGTHIGFPTLNVYPAKGKLLPPDGVYASVTSLPDQTERYGLTNLGMRPTVGGSRRRAETTLFDYDADLYGAIITTNLLLYLRPEKKFSGLDDLKAQIREDERMARQISLWLPTADHHNRG